MCLVPESLYHLFMATTTTSTESRALALLGQGLGPEIVASAIGISVSRISQLLSEPEFAAQVANLRFESLAAHTSRDRKYDSMEDSLLEKLQNCLPFMVKPFEILKAIQIINSAKRRGASSPDHISGNQEVVQLVMPVQIFQQFTTNVNNQVVKAGAQELVTVQSGNMQKLLDRSKTKEVQNVENANIRTG